VLEALDGLVDPALEALHVRRGDAQVRGPVLAVADRHAEVAADVEEVVLDGLEPRPQRVVALRARHAEQARQLVHGPERGHPQVVLGDARPVAEPSGPVVALSRVDPTQVHHRLTSVVSQSPW
jgi:hypothetical protein